MTKTKEVLFQLPGEDERAVKLAATVQGMSNAIAAYAARSTLKNDATNRAVMAIHAYPAWMNLRNGDKQGTNNPARFADIFLPLCQRIHLAMYNAIERDPGMYRKVVDGGRDLLDAKLAAVAMKFLPVIEGTPDSEPIVFIWPELPKYEQAVMPSARIQEAEQPALPQYEQALRGMN